MEIGLWKRRFICVCLYCGMDAFEIYLKKKAGYIIMNIGMLLVVIFMVVAGLGSTIAIVITMFAVLGQKIYRKIKYGASLYD